HPVAAGLPVVKRAAVVLAGLAAMFGAAWWRTARAPAPAPRPAPTLASVARVERPRPARPRPALPVALASPPAPAPPPPAPAPPPPAPSSAASPAALDSSALVAELAALDRRWHDWPEAVFVCQADGEHIYRPEEHDPLAADVYARKFPDD